MNFPKNYQLSCVIGGNFVNAVQRHGELGCVVPSLPPGNYSVCISSIDMIFCNHQLSLFLRCSLVVSITPSVSFIIGGGVVSIQGHSFEMAEHFSCKFDRNLSPASVLSSTLMTCEIPPYSYFHQGIAH